jgi:hypothetical protein
MSFHKSVGNINLSDDFSVQNITVNNATIDNATIQNLSSSGTNIVTSGSNLNTDFLVAGNNNNKSIKPTSIDASSNNLSLPAGKILTVDNITSSSGQNLNISSPANKDIVIDSAGSGVIKFLSIPLQGLQVHVNPSTTRIDNFIIVPNGDLLQRSLCLGVYNSVTTGQFNPFIASQVPGVSNQNLYIGSDSSRCVCIAANLENVTDAQLSGYSLYLYDGSFNISTGGLYLNGSLFCNNSRNVTASAVTSSGNINSSSGSLQTNSVTRIDNSGNVTAGSVSCSTVTASSNFNSSAGGYQINGNTVINSSSEGNFSNITSSGGGFGFNASGAANGYYVQGVECISSSRVISCNGVNCNGAYDATSIGGVYRVNGATVINNSKQFFGNAFIQNNPGSSSLGSLYISSSAVTTINTQNTYVLVNATSCASGNIPAQQATINTSTPRITCNASLTQVYRVTCSYRISGTAGDVYSVRIAKNGTTIASSEMRGEIDATLSGNLSLAMNNFAHVSLANNDYVEPFITNNTAGRNATVNFLIMDILPTGFQ